MKKIYIATLSSLLFIFLSIASLSAQLDGPKTIFWEITGEKLSKPSYLFGSMHIIPKIEFQPFEQVDDLLMSSDRLVLEMIIDVPLKTQMEWAKMMILPEGVLISDIMNEEDFAKVKSYAMDTLDVKEFLFNAYLKLKPFAFYSALIPHAIGEKIEGYELHFSKIAKKEEIPTIGLENFEFQMGIFDSIPNTRQLEMFFSEDIDLKKEMAEMLELFFSQDIYKMAAMISEEDSEYAEFESELVSLRNENWSGQLEKLMQEYSCFIAVGAAHLAGENGLITMLREKGFTVKPICLIPGCE